MMRSMAASSSGSGLAGQLPILTFHGFGSPGSTISFPPEVFRKGVARLARNGYETIDLMNAVENLKVGVAPPSNAIILTIDDGYESVYREALPVLEEHRMTATIFVTTGASPGERPSDRLPTLEGQRMMSWNELRKAVSAGCSIGAHTLTHPDLTRLSMERLTRQLIECRTILEQRLGVPVRSFAYPYGRYNRRVREAVSRHYECACSDQLGLLRPTSDPYALPRVEMYYLRRSWTVGLLTSPLLAPYLALRAIPRGARRAVRDRR